MRSSTPGLRTLALCTSLAVPLATLAPLLMPSTAFASHSECSDGIDNDADGRVDYPQDPHCASLDDPFEGGASSGVFVSITDNKESIVAGQTMLYVITLVQQRADLRTVDLDLHFPAEVDILSVTAGGDIHEHDIRWRSVTLQYNIPVKMVVQARVKTTAETNRLIVARAATEGMSATDTTKVVAAPDLPLAPVFSASISDGQDLVQTQQKLTYVLRATNLTGEEQVTRVQVTIPPMLGLLATSPAGAQYINNLKLQWMSAHFLPHETREFILTARVQERLQDYVSIHVRALVGSVTATDVSVIKTGFPDNVLSLSLTADRATASPGQLVTYALHVSNPTAQTATSADVHASIPLFSEFVSVTEGGNWDGRTVTWRPLVIAPGGIRILTYTVRVRSDAQIGENLRASAETDGVKDAAQTTVIAPVKRTASTGYGMTASLLRKTADRSEVLPGGRVRYTISIRNVLLHPIRDAVLTDRFDPAIVSLVDRGDAEVVGDGQLQWKVPVLQPGEAWQVSYTVQVRRNVENGTSIGSVARLSGADLEDAAFSERVTVTKTGVLTDLPPTGAAMDALFSLVLLPLSLGMALAQRSRRVLV